VSVFIVRIDQRGRISLPCDLRGELSLELGDFVMLSMCKNKLTVKPSTQSGRLISRNVFEL